MICYLQPSEMTIDHAVQPRTGLDTATVQRYAEAIAIAQDWPFPPVRAFEDGDGTLWLADGFHRIAALTAARRSAQTANVTAKVEVTPGSRRDAILFAVGSNGEHGLSRTDDDLRRAIATLLLDPEWGKWSTREIARQCRVGRTRVNTVRESLEAAGSLARRASEVTYTDKHGNTSSMKVGAIGRGGDACEADNDGAIGDNCFEPSGVVESVAGGTGDDGVATAPPATTVTEDDTDVSPFVQFRSEVRASMSPEDLAAFDRLDPSRAPSTREQVLSSKSDEWYSTDMPLNPARKIMGGFELDPASCTEANERVKAERFFSIDDDGLSQTWRARSVWFNPPYGGQTAKWVDKLIGHYRCDDIGQAMALLNAVPHRRWFQRLWSVSAAVCFLDDMIRFHAPGGERGEQPTYGNVLFYLTTGSVGGFVEAFTPHGRVVVAQSAAAQLVRRDPAMKILIERAS